MCSCLDQCLDKCREMIIMFLITCLVELELELSFPCDGDVIWCLCFLKYVFERYVRR